MRRYVLIGLGLLAACDDKGSIDVATDDVSTSDDVALTDTDSVAGTDTDRTDSDVDTSDSASVLPDTDGGPVSANDCGSYIVPPAKFAGTATTVSVGKTTAKQKLGTFGGWTWKGCEVERHFDSAGAFECEIWRSARGDGSQSLFGSPGFTFDMKLTVDAARSTCPGAQDLNFRYGIDTDVFSQKLTLSRAVSGSDSFAAIDSTGYTGNFTGVGGFTFRYATDFFPR